jgi:hypothetical protein
MALACIENVGWRVLAFDLLSSGIPEHSLRFPARACHVRQERGQGERPSTQMVECYDGQYPSNSMAPGRIERENGAIASRHARSKLR